MNFTIEQMSAEFTKYHLNPEGSAPWPFRPVLHHFTATDVDGPHDHPWPFQTFILSGGYVEEVFTIADDGTWSSEIIHRRANTAHRVEATHIHRIVELPQGDCWTLILPSPAERESRFWRFDADGVSSRAWHQTEFTPLRSAVPA